MKKFILFAFTTGLLSAVVTSSFTAEASDEAAVKARRGYFAAMSFSATPLMLMGTGKVQYNAEKAQGLANNLKLFTESSIQGMWPKGTDASALKGQTRAKAEIWAADSNFRYLLTDLRRAAAEIASVAGKGKDNMERAAYNLARTCSECHRRYRNRHF